MNYPRLKRDLSTIPPLVWAKLGEAYSRTAPSHSIVAPLTGTNSKTTGSAKLWHTPPLIALIGGRDNLTPPPTYLSGNGDNLTLQPECSTRAIRDSTEH